MFFASALHVGCLVAPAVGQLSITSNFDYGSLASWSGDLGNVSLHNRDNYFGNDKWRWMYFKASGVLGATPVFSINQNFAGDATPGPHELRDQEMVYSYDNQNWSFFDNNQLVATNTDLFRFSNNSPFTQNEVYVAYAIPYSYGKSVAHTQAVLASPWAAPTVSGDANGVIGQSKQVVDDLNRTVSPLNLYAYRITNPATDSSTIAKKKVGLSTGLHAGEPLGTYAYEGLVNWLISDDPRAARLRNVAEFFCYPVLNPTGRYAGYNRSTVGDPNVDPNGLWDSTRWSNSTYGCGNNNCQDIRSSGQAMIADVASTPGSALDAFIDFHSTVPDYTGDGVVSPGETPNSLPDDFGYIDIAGGKANANWWQIFRARQPNVYQWQSGNGSYTTTGFARRVLGAKVDVTLETQFTWERNIDYYHDLGKNFGVAFYQAWVPQIDGDFSGDGIVDAADYNLWRDSLGQAGPGLLADGNHNNLIDRGDYDIWKANFGLKAGSASGDAGTATSVTSIPEPITLLLFLQVALFAAVRRKFATNQSAISRASSTPP